MVIESREPYSLQKYYDQLVCHTLDGGFPSISKNYSCKYQTDDGKACAAGILIPDVTFLN